MNVVHEGAEKRLRVRCIKLPILLDTLHKPERSRIGSELRPRINAGVERSTGINREGIVTFITERCLGGVKPVLKDRPALREGIIVHASHVANDQFVNSILRAERVHVLGTPKRKPISEVEDWNLTERVQHRPLPVIL